jgi:Fe-Mn family superoxide dismutase
LKIIATANADTPVAHGQQPVLTLDVWEHAYYLDHQNRRADFVDAFLAHLVDWNWVSENL